MLKLEENNSTVDTPKTWSYSRRDMVAFLLKKFSALSPLLDIGCGPGVPWPGFDTFGLDVNPEVAELAKQ